MLAVGTACEGLGNHFEACIHDILFSTEQTLHDVNLDTLSLLCFVFVFVSVADQPTTGRVLGAGDGSRAAEQPLSRAAVRADHGKGRRRRDELGADILPLHAGASTIFERISAAWFD